MCRQGNKGPDQRVRSYLVLNGSEELDVRYDPAIGTHKIRGSNLLRPMSLPRRCPGSVVPLIAEWMNQRRRGKS